MIRYNDLIKKIEGKGLNESFEIIKKEKIFKVVNNVTLFSKIEETINKINSFSKNIPSVYIYLKEETIFFDELELFTNIEEVPKNGDMNNYSFKLRDIMGLIDTRFKTYDKFIDDGLRVVEQSIINELVNVFNTKLPTIEEIQEMKNELDNVFSDESPEKLQKIEDILSFNDSTITSLKDALIQSGIDAARNKTSNEIKENK